MLCGFRQDIQASSQALGLCAKCFMSVLRWGLLEGMQMCPLYLEQHG